MRAGRPLSESVEKQYQVRDLMSRPQCSGTFSLSPPVAILRNSVPRSLVPISFFLEEIFRDIYIFPPVSSSSFLFLEQDHPVFTLGAAEGVCPLSWGLDWKGEVAVLAARFRESDK